MTPRPFHRWKTFWLGVLVLVFLAWGWGRSRHQTEGFLWLARDFHLSGGQSTGRIEIAWAAADGAWGRDFLWLQEAASTTGEPRFPKAVNWETYPGKRQLTVAHWFLMLLLLVPWTCFLVWRCRRMNARAAHREGSAP